MNNEYKEHDEVEELDLISRMHGRFKGTGLAMPAPQRALYEAVKERMLNDTHSGLHYPKFVYKPTVVDIGCGIGLGTSIMGQEAKFAWGIDKNEESVNFAKQLFQRLPNNVYTSPQISFDVVDVLNFNREIVQKFDYIVSVEVIEHFNAEHRLKYLEFIKKIATPKSKIFISTPNRLAPSISKDTPKNPHHCYEFPINEFYDLMIKHFKSVTMWDYKLENKLELDSQVTPMVAECIG